MLPISAMSTAAMPKPAHTTLSVRLRVACGWESHVGAHLLAGVVVTGSALSDEDSKSAPVNSTQEHEELQVVVTNSSAPTPATSDADSSDDEDGGLLGGSTMNLLALPQTASNASLLESVGVGSSRQRLMHCRKCQLPAISLTACRGWA